MLHIKQRKLFLNYQSSKLRPHQIKTSNQTRNHIRDGPRTLTNQSSAHHFPTTAAAAVASRQYFIITSTSRDYLPPTALIRPNLRNTYSWGRDLDCRKLLPWCVAIMHRVRVRPATIEQSKANNETAQKRRTTTTAFCPLGAISLRKLELRAPVVVAAGDFIVSSGK